MTKPRTLATRAAPAAVMQLGRTRGAEGTARVPGEEDGVRERIQVSALELFGRYGYDGVSMQRIADAVGLHKSSLFHYYSGKLELLDDALGTAVSRLLSLLAPLLVEERPTLETLNQAVRLLVDHFSEHPQTARLVVTLMVAPDDSEVRKLPSSERSLGFYLGLSRWLERARRAGVIRACSIRQAIPNLMGLVLFYPAVAGDLRELVGAEPFSARAREVRKEELTRLVQAMFAPG
jgi:AcrR family transcriptional regulator